MAAGRKILYTNLLIQNSKSIIISTSLKALQFLFYWNGLKREFIGICNAEYTILIFNLQN